MKKKFMNWWKAKSDIEKSTSLTVAAIFITSINIVIIALNISIICR